MKRVLCMAALLVCCLIATATAAYQQEDIDCPNSYKGGVSRVVRFCDDPPCLDENSYYVYWITCDGKVYDSRGNEEVHPVGQLPLWAFPFTMTQVVEDSQGAVHMQFLHNGYLAATIDYDQVEGHSATMTTYPNPLE